jgi:hypothetical protein
MNQSDKKCFVNDAEQDITKNIASMIVEICSNNIIETTIFTGSSVPDLTIPKYIKRLTSYFKCYRSIQLTALIIIDKFCQAAKITINKLTVHRLIAISYIIATKYLEDDHYSNKFYSVVCGFDLKEVNALELIMLQTLNFDIFIDSKLFDTYLTKFLEYIENLELICDE